MWKLKYENVNQMCDIVSYFFSKVNNMDDKTHQQQVELRELVGERELEDIRKTLREEVKRSLASELTSEQEECIDAVEDILLAHIKRARKLGNVHSVGWSK